jgi:hypothetical protein
MEIINKSMDAYEIAENLFNNKFENNNIDISTNQDLKTYFEMLVIITVEGLKKFFGNENNTVDIELLSKKDFAKLNSYLNHININMKLKIIDLKRWEQYDKYHTIMYNKQEILDSTKLEDLNFIIEKNNVYVINFVYKII